MSSGLTGRSSTSGSPTRFSCDARRTETSGRSRRSASGTPRGSSASRCTCCATPRTRATPPRSRSRSSCAGSASSGASRSSRPGCTASSSTPARTSRRRGGRRAADRAARSRTRASPRTATRCARSPRRETRRELGRCLAELPPAQATVVALKDAFDVGVRRDLGGDGTSGRHGEVLRPPRPERAARAAHRHDRRRAHGQGRDRGDPAAPRPDAADRRGASSSCPGERVVARKTVTEEDCAGHFPGNPIMPGVKMVEALAQCGAVAVLSQPENRGKLALFAGIDDVRFKRHRAARRVADARVRGRDRARAGRQGQGARDGRRRARRARHAHLRGGRRASDRPRDRAAGSRSPASAATCPSASLTNDDLARARRHLRRVDHGAHRHPRAADRRRRRGDVRHLRCRLRAARSRRPAPTPATIDLLIVATVTPDMAFPSTARSSPTRSACPTPRPTTSRPAAPASCTRSPRRTRCSRPASRKRALVVGGDVLSKILDWTDRSTLVLFGDGAGAVVLERVDDGGFLGFELGADGGGGSEPVAARQRLAAVRGSRAVRQDERPRGLQVRDARDGQLGRGDSRASAARRSTTSTCTSRTRRTSGSSTTLPQTRLPEGEGRRERRTVRQHLVGLDPARARRRGRRRAPRARQAGADDGHGRRPHLGLGVDRMDTSRRLERAA